MEDRPTIRMQMSIGDRGPLPMMRIAHEQFTTVTGAADALRAAAG